MAAVDSLDRERIETAVFGLTNGLLPVWAEAFWGSEVGAWLTSFRNHANRLPRWLLQHLAEMHGSPPPPSMVGIFDDDMPQRVRFPKIEKAASTLITNGVMTRPQFDQLSRQSRAKAFTIAGEIRTDTIERVRDLLANTIAEGPTLRKFRRDLEDKIGTGLLGPAHVETVYRTNIQAAYRDGTASLMKNPIVASVFPYQEYLPIHDARARANHLALGHLGLNGTGIYRRDDPFWDYFTPPCGFNCRCGTNLLTLESAARKGVREAQRWLETGVEPSTPEHRLKFIPFEPEDGFGARHGILAA